MISTPKRRITSVLVSLSLIASMTGASLAASTSTSDSSTSSSTSDTSPELLQDGGASSSSASVSFSDVAGTDWFYEAVSAVASLGIMTGSDGTFSPDSVITKSAFIQALYTACSSPSVTATSTSFTDVSSSDSYYTAVLWAVENGILDDTDDTLFNPSASLTRETALTFIYRAADLLGLTLTEGDSSTLSSYSDSGSVSSESNTAISALVATGIVQGNSDGTLSLSDELTNAQVATIFYRILGGSGGSSEQMDVPPGGSFGGSSTVTQGSYANLIDSDTTIDGTTYTSTGDDENALRVSDATVELDNITVSKTDGTSSNTENGDFYGVNAGLLATDGANVTINNATVNTSAQNGNGVFSYGEGTVVTISNSTINTTGNNSGGIQTTGGGTTYAYALNVTTQGNSSAAIRSDRGGGTVVVDGGTYTTSGTGSPAVYSTADITVKNSTLTANNSEGLVIEGENSIALEDCDVSGNMSGTYGDDSSENIHTVMIYQSMSGDADVGTSSFSMTGGSLVSNNGDMIYVTNTDCTIYLSDVDLTLADNSDNLLVVEGNSSSRGWGTAGSNGGNVEFTADGQTLTGNIIVDTISTLDFTLSNSSVFTGTITIEDNAAGGTAVSDNADVTIEAGSTWNLTGDSTVSTLTNNGTINFNGYTITLADGTVLSD
ncbi:MAG: hypothetical protein H6Q60_1137 [Oscillospiraceae bacterium]|nr:hypothetical protein [Oscillospiraceae bacterium]